MFTDGNFESLVEYMKTIPQISYGLYSMLNNHHNDKALQENMPPPHCYAPNDKLLQTLTILSWTIWENNFDLISFCGGEKIAWEKYLVTCGGTKKKETCSAKIVEIKRVADFLRKEYAGISANFYVAGRGDVVYYFRTPC